MIPRFRAFRSFTYLLFFACTSHRFLAQGKTVSRLIDDTYGDHETGAMPAYYPKGDNVWQGNDCTQQHGGCAIVPDQNRAQNGTWMAATYRTNIDNLGFTLQFEGTAISVYFILANNLGVSGITTRTECNFTLDGVLRKQYSHQPTSQLGLEYNVQVYNETGLENKMHMLEVSTGKLDHEVFINFDYAMYTAEIPDDTSESPPSKDSSNANGSNNNSKSTPVGAIVGGVIGGIVILCLIAVIVFLLLKKKGRDKGRPLGGDNFHEPEIFPYSAPTIDTNRIQSTISPYPATLSTGALLSPRPPPSSYSSSSVYSNAQAPVMAETGQLLHEVQTMREQLHHLRSREKQSIAASGDQDNELSDLREQIRELQAQMDAMHPLPPSYSPG